MEVRTGGGLVEEDDGRPGDELRGNADPALLPTRQPADKCIANETVGHLQIMHTKMNFLPYRRYPKYRNRSNTRNTQRIKIREK
eukprot:scaffold80957_cov34-Prasinocladus_malaysianus.AAC.1